MKRFIISLGKVDIHFSTFFIVFFAIVSGRFQSFIFLFLFTMIHELFHIMTALLFKVKVDKISVLPFGFSAKMESLYNVEWYKELLIVIMGPLSYFFTNYLILLMHKIQLISLIGLSNANTINNFILAFNLLPIIPLDGSKIIKIFLDFFITEKKSMKLNGLISIIFLLLYFIFLPMQFTIYLFLIYSQSEYWFYLKNNYALFLISRLKKFKLKLKIHNKNDFYKNFTNIFLKRDKIYSEEEYLKKIYGGDYENI